MTADHRSVRFHLSYPRQATVLTWPECACLARSLGYRDASIELCYRQAVDARHQTEGLQVSQLDACLGSKFFKSGFDFSYNSHSCEWNEQVVRRACAVVAGRGMTFQQLYTTRIAYGLYESSDLRGLKAKPRTVMRALRACGRAISLGKMAHRVRHMRFHEPGRLQLDEFIDLALWAGPLDREEARAALPPAASARPDPGTRLHQLVNFGDLLTPLDGRIQRRLDAEYRREERQYVREKVRSTEPRLRQCSVLGYRQARLARSREAQAAIEPLRRVLRDGGGSCGRPATAAAFTENSSDWTDDEEVGQPRDARDKKRLATARPSSTPLVTPSDLERTELLRDALAFQSNAAPVLHERWTAEDMQALRPGFHRRHAQRVESAAAEAEAAGRAEEARRRATEAAEARRDRLQRRQQRQQRFAELADRTDPAPLPAHGRVCDAPERGVRAPDGGLLTTTCYEPSYQGRLLQALSDAEDRQVRRVRGNRVGDADESLALRRRQQQQQRRRRRPATTSSARRQQRQVDDEDDFWLEPQLGLPMPLASPVGTRPTLSRLSYARACPPRIHAIADGLAAAEAAELGDDGKEVAELIQRVVYA